MLQIRWDSTGLEVKCDATSVPAALAAIGAIDGLLTKQKSEALISAAAPTRKPPSPPAPKPAQPAPAKPTNGSGLGVEVVGLRDAIVRALRSEDAAMSASDVVRAMNRLRIRPPLAEGPLSGRVSSELANMVAMKLHGVVRVSHGQYSIE